MPVIMASGTSPAKELKLHPGLRLEAALRKPVTSDKLLRTVKNVLHTRESSREQLTPQFGSQDRSTVG